MSENAYETHLLELSCEANSKALAEQFTKYLKIGDVILLDGDLGAGKSFFARSMIQHIAKKQLNEDIAVPSPTFSLVQVYENLVPSIWHFDLYRTSSADEAYDLGLEDAFKEAICLIEWPSKLEGDYPASALLLFLNYVDDDQRKLKILAPKEWQSRMTQILSDYEPNI